MSDQIGAAQGSGQVLLASTPGRTPAARLGIAVVKDLVTAVVTGSVHPGDTLPPESVLIQQFAVSRTVIRESVKRLEEKGLVTVSQGRGTIVNSPSRWNVLDPDVLSALVDNDESLEILDELAVVRASLEASMAAAAAARQTDASSTDLRRAHEATESALRNVDAGDEADAAFDDMSYNDADAAFHDMIMEQSGNRLAANITRILFARARESSRFTGTQGVEAVRRTLGEHRAIMEAVIAGDADKAAEAMSTHITQAWYRRRPEMAP